MNDEEKQQRMEGIRKLMEQRSTEELLQIWTTGDEAEWTGEALDIARETLESRVGALPPRLREAIASEGSEGEPSETSEEPDTYHSLGTVVRIANAAKTLGWAALGLLGFSILVDIVLLVGRQPPFDYEAAAWPVIRSWLLPALCAGFFCAVLQAVGEGLYVLLDIESNTRGGVRSQTEE